MEHTFKQYTGAEVTITLDPSRDDALTPFGKATLHDRYLLPGETPQQMMGRVACYFSSDAAHAQRMYHAISRLWFMPATPVLSNGGSGRGLPISCYLNEVDDSMQDIAAAWMENIWLAARGGGIGTGWGKVRSIGEAVGEVGRSSGLVPFLKVQDSMTLAISQGSLRRGSAAVYLPIDHPEIEEFIEIRRPTGADPNRRTLNIHHGVTVSDKFMNCVLQNQPFDLVSPHTGKVVRTVNARALFQRLLHARVETGEPYIVFSDTTNHHASDIYKALRLKITQSNLCAEIALATGKDHLSNARTAVCCLSSLNMETYDEWRNNDTLVKDALRFLDNVIECFIQSATEPGFERARYAAMRERAVGLGVMGFHGYLQSKGVPFESAMAKSINRHFFKWLHAATDRANRELGEELGPCPDAIDAGLTARATNVTAIAPTASISIICGGATPGIEPMAANAYTHKTLSGSYFVRNKYLDKQIRDMYDTGSFAVSDDQVWHDAYTTLSREDFMEHVWQSISVNSGSIQHLPHFSKADKMLYRTAMEIDQRWVIELAADRAPYITQGQSVNLFLPANVHKWDLLNLHIKAWELGVKSLYYCRSRSVQRSDAISHMAGTMPTEGDRPDVNPTRIDYEECLACQ